MIRAVVLFVALVLVGLFSLLNWNEFIAPTPLSLGFTTVQAPLGLTMLGILVFISILFIVWAMSLQASALMEHRRMTKELTQQRDLADKAEASRITELRQYLATELTNVGTTHEQTRAMLVSRIERSTEAFQRSHEESNNTMAALIGELEDRLDRARVLADPDEARRVDRTLGSPVDVDLNGPEASSRGPWRAPADPLRLRDPDQPMDPREPRL